MTEENQYERLLKQQKIYIVFGVSFIIFIIYFIFLIITSSIKWNILTIPFWLFLVITALVSILYFYISIKRWWLGMKWYLKIENQWKSSVIEIDGVKKNFIENKMKGFFWMYRDKNILEKNYDVDIQSVWEKCFLIFNQPIEFKTFAFLVNYLSFLESQKHNVTWRYSAKIWVQTTWWYRSGISFLNSEKDIMVYSQSKNEWDKNSVYCVLDNQFGFIKPLYLVRHFFERPPSYKFLLPLDQSIPLIGINPLFWLKNIKEYGEKTLKKYKERPNIQIKDCKQQTEFVIKQENEKKPVNMKKEAIIWVIVLLALFWIWYLCKIHEQNKEKELEAQDNVIETVINLDETTK